MTEVRNLRCVVKVGDQIESILEAEESIILDHVNETVRTYDEEDFKFVQIIITHPHHMNRYKYVDDETIDDWTDYDNEWEEEYEKETTKCTKEEEIDTAYKQRDQAQEWKDNKSIPPEVITNAAKRIRNRVIKRHNYRRR